MTVEAILDPKIGGGAEGLERPLQQLVGQHNGYDDPESQAPHILRYDGAGYVIDVDRATAGPSLRLVAGGINHLALTSTGASSALAWTLGSTLAVNGLSTLNGAAIAGDLGVTGNTTLGNAAGSDTLTVNAISTFNGATTLNGATVTGDLGVTGDADIGGNVDIGGNLTVDGTLTIAALTTHDLTVTGNASIGNGNADVHTVIGITTIRGTGGNVLGHFDPGNNRTLFGSSTPLGSDTAPNTQVIGRLYVAPETSNDTAFQVRRSNSHTVGFTFGVTSGNDLAIKDDSDTQVATVGDAASTYQLRVHGDLNVTDDSYLDGDLNLTGNYTQTSGTFRHESGGNARIVANSTGVGFFGATPIARPTVVGSRGGIVALENLLEELANLGLVTDLSTA